MKHMLFFALLLISFNAVSQVTFNQDKNLFQYEFTEQNINYSTDIKEIKLIELGFDEIKKIDNVVYGKSFFTKMIYGSAMEIHYTIKFENEKIIFSNFKINDVRYGRVALEELKKTAQKKWINEIDSRIPDVIRKLNN